MIPALARRAGDHAMEKDITKAADRAAEGSVFDNWIDAIEDGVRSRVRDFILERQFAFGLKPRIAHFVGHDARFHSAFASPAG